MNITKTRATRTGNFLETRDGLAVGSIVTFEKYEKPKIVTYNAEVLKKPCLLCGRGEKTGIITLKVLKATRGAKHRVGEEMKISDKLLYSTATIVKNPATYIRQLRVVDYSRLTGDVVVRDDDMPCAEITWIKNEG